MYGLSNDNIVRYNLLVDDDLLSNFINIKNLSSDFGSTTTIKTFDFIKLKTFDYLISSDTMLYYANNKVFELNPNDKSTFTNILTLDSNILSYFVDSNNTIWL